MGLNRNINDDSTLAYLFNKTRQGASDALGKAIEKINDALTVINNTIASIQTALNNKVSKSGDTMTGPLVIEGAGGEELQIVHSATAKGGAENSYKRVIFQDENLDTVAILSGDILDTGATRARLQASGVSTNNYLQLLAGSDGTKTVVVNAPEAWRSALNAVNKAGDTMTGNLEIELSGIPHFYLNNKLADTSLATDTATRQWSIYHKDKNGKVISYWESTFNTAGTAATSFRARRIVNGSSADNGVNFSITADGTRTVSVSSPAAWRTALGLGGMATVASPAPIANGGTGQTAVTAISTISQIVTAASGFTVENAYYTQWGKVAMFTIAFKKTTAQTTVTSMNAGTLVSGKRPAHYAPAVALNSTISWSDVYSNGNIRLTGTWGANVTIYVHSIYLLP